MNRLNKVVLWFERNIKPRYQRLTGFDLGQVPPQSLVPGFYVFWRFFLYWEQMIRPIGRRNHIYHLKSPFFSKRVYTQLSITHTRQTCWSIFSKKNVHSHAQKKPASWKITTFYTEKLFCCLFYEWINWKNMQINISSQCKSVSM